jgi:hypothetical protein
LIEKLEAIPELKPAKDPEEQEQILALKVQMQTYRD